MVHLPAREIPPPAYLSAAARESLAAPAPALGPWPDLGDKDGWRAKATALNAAKAAATAPVAGWLTAEVAARSMAGTPVYVATPPREHLLDARRVILDFHGGALMFFGGEAHVRYEAAAIAQRTGRVTYAVDYRVPPDHPFPAALEDGVAVYETLLQEKNAPSEIVVCGSAAGAGLAVAVLLRARDQGLPMPAGLLLMTPELDLTERGDTFTTLMDLDIGMAGSLRAVSLAYADGADLEDPYVSPLLGDVAGFPPTFLQAGTRDVFLSSAAIMHRKLRHTGVRAELHVWEGMPHGGFNGLTPEDREVDAEMRAFIAAL